jgi:hypothetical protein
MAASQASSPKYTVVRPFHRVDQKTGKNKAYEIGDTYTDDDIESYLEWWDGPLIATASDAKDIVADAKASTDDGSVA